MKVLANASLYFLFSQAYKKIPKATQSCQPITKLPLMEAGEFSAANTGIVDALVPIPMPSSRRQTKSCGHVWVNAEPMTDQRQKNAEMNIVPRRPRRWFKGCENQQPLVKKVSAAGSALRENALHECSCEIRCGIDQPQNPCVSATAACLGIKTEGLWPVEVGSIRPRLVPSPTRMILSVLLHSSYRYGSSSLYCGADTAGDDCDV